MSIRFVLALITTPLELAAIFYAGRYLLPGYDINIPLLALIAIMAAWLGWSVVSYRIGSHALRRKLLANQTSMVGSHGTVTQTLQPDGMVRIGGELWQARASDGRIPAGARVVVIAQDGLRLIVRLVEAAK